MLTIWLDLGEDKNLCLHDPFRKMTADISRAMKDAPVYKVRLLYLSARLILMQFVVVHSISSDRFPSCP
jgi:hypothetical protein